MNRCLHIAVSVLVFLSHSSQSSFSAPPPSLDQRLVGNVYGRETDALTSFPIEGAEIALFDQPLAKFTAGTTVRTDRGNFTLPDLQSAVRRGTTTARGEFLINFVPTPFPFKPYTVIVRAKGHRSLVLDQVRVYPGAAMALRVDCPLPPGSEAEATVFFAGDPALPVKYRHEERLPILPPKPAQIAPPRLAALSHTVFATREGLVGGTTANGHIIQLRDHFVALPSRRALNPDDQTDDFLVELEVGAKTVRAPVWDVGPWNTRDDYWNPAAVRELWTDLAEGTPESQVAYLNDYNAGHDQFGRDVLNPAGIDLADGTFWDDLGLSNNEWVSVAYLWRPGVVVGQRVRATTALNVRSTPAGSLIGTVPAGSVGAITGGPQGAWFNQCFYVWWVIRWDGVSLSGWSVENWLILAPTAARPTWSHYR